MELTAKQKTALWLDRFPLDRKTKIRFSEEKELFKSFPSVWEKVIKKPQNDVYNSMAKSLSDGGKYFSSIVQNLESYGITPVTVFDENYPDELQSMPDRPLVLYAVGDTTQLKKQKFTVVGSRRTQRYALANAVKITQDVSRYFCVCTGVADGVEREILSVLDGGVCVLPSGIDSMPKTGEKIFADFIRRGGLMIGVCPIDTPVLKYSFGYRNEILARLGVGGLVTSGSTDSGTLITANYLKKFNKSVFAFPYPPNEETGAGCNLLIKQGAFLTENVEDILPHFSIETTKTEPEPTEETDDLDENENKIMQAFGIEKELAVSEIITKTGLPVAVVNLTITGLEIKGVVERIGGNRIRKMRSTKK